MTTQHGNCRQTPPVDTAAGLEAVARHLSEFHRISWRQALGGFTSAAGRLHRYRDLRTRMFHAALGEERPIAGKKQEGDGE